MHNTRFAEHKSIIMIKSLEAGRIVKDVCWDLDISRATYSTWKSKYGGMEAYDIKKRQRILKMKTAISNSYLPISVSKTTC